MARYIQAQAAGAGFRGVKEIFQYTNDDGQDPATVCGQAACATLLTYAGLMPADIKTLRQIEASHHPDLLGGALGTSPGRIRSILEHYGAKSLVDLNHEKDLKAYVAAEHPVVCLIQNEGGLLGLRNGAHWFVVFAYDDDGVFVTNYGDVRLTWDSFDDKWHSLTTFFAMLDFRGIATNTLRIPMGSPPAPRGARDG